MLGVCRRPRVGTSQRRGRGGRSAAGAHNVRSPPGKSQDLRAFCEVRGRWRLPRRASVRLLTPSELDQ
eukprot:5003563-Prymnesium_polylepis.1